MDTLNRSSEAELMLLLAGSAERRRRRHERIRELAGAIDEQAFGAEAARQGVQLVVARRLVELGLASERFEHSLQRAVKLNGRRVFPIEARTMFATRALAQAGIPAMPLKGPGLARIVHGTPEMRGSVALDTLVARGNLDGALRAVGRVGYSRSPGAAISKVPIVLSSPDADAPPIELHWRPPWFGDAFSSRLLAEGKLDQDGTLQPS